MSFMTLYLKVFKTVFYDIAFKTICAARSKLGDTVSVRIPLAWEPFLGSIKADVE